MVDDYGRPIGATPDAPEPVRRVAAAMGEGWRATPSILTDEGTNLIRRYLDPYTAKTIAIPGAQILGGALGAWNALMYGGAEVANQVTGDPRAGRDALILAQVAPMAAHGFAGPKAFDVAPRVSPMMDAFDRMEAQRATEPSRPPPPSEAESGIARVHAQLGVGPDRPPPPPSPIPAEAAPPGVPPGTEVPIDLRLRAAINAVPPAPEPAPTGTVVPPVNVDPITGQRTPVQAPPPERVPPGSTGPAATPYAAPPEPGRGAANQATPPPAAPEAPATGGWRPVRPDEVFQPGQQFRMNQTTGTSEVYEPSMAPSSATPPQSRVSPMMEQFNQGTAARTPPPPPRDAGAAATPPTAFGRSAREIKGQQADMELADLMRTPQPGDARDIIPGAAQTKAEIELSPDVSREAKGLRQEFREGFNDHEKANNELYHRHIDDVVPPREDIATMKDVREQHWQDAEKTVFGLNPNGEPVSTAPVVNHMKAVLADPVEKANSYLKAALKPYLDALTDKDGNPITMGAKELYGQRQEMARNVKDMATDPKLAHVRGQFGDLLDMTDNTITTGAPSYRTMMDNYKAESGPINAAERLADIKLKVTNGSDRVITFGAMDRYMKSLWMERHGPNPYAPAKSIPQATWDHLMQLHERLARSASADELARTKGSDTTQLMMEMARKGAIGAAHLLAAKIAPGLGNLAVPYITKQIDARMAQKKVGQHLNPDLSQYPPTVP
jgi:hypothetical protein